MPTPLTRPTRKYCNLIRIPEASPQLHRRYSRFAPSCLPARYSALSASLPISCPNSRRHSWPPRSRSARETSTSSPACQKQTNIRPETHPGNRNTPKEAFRRHSRQQPTCSVCHQARSPETPPVQRIGSGPTGVPLLDRPARRQMNPSSPSRATRRAEPKAFMPKVTPNLLRRSCRPDNSLSHAPLTYLVAGRSNHRSFLNKVSTSMETWNFIACLRRPCMRFSIP